MTSVSFFVENNKEEKYHTRRITLFYDAWGDATEILTTNKVLVTNVLTNVADFCKIFDLR